MENTEPKVYEIDSWEKLHNVVNEENFTSFMIDFANYLGFYVQSIKQMKNHTPKFAELSNVEICQSKMRWIDDGKNDFLTYEIENADTGEISRHPINDSEE